MPNSSSDFSTAWLECVATELKSRKLPRREITRLITELSDHLSDLAESLGTTFLPPAVRSNVPPLSSLSPSLKDEAMSMEAIAANCLGSPAEIADTALGEFRKRKNLLSRSPLAAFATFVLLPLPLLVAAWLALMTISGLSLGALEAGLAWSGILPASSTGAADEEVGEALGGWLRDANQFELVVVHLLLIAEIAVPAAAVAVLLGWLARRTARRWLWGMTACALVGLGFGAAQYDLKISDLPGKSQLMFMLGLGHNPLRQCCYSLLPLGVGVLVLRRADAVANGTPA